MDNIRINAAITVPQLFYDLIARVFPGFLFLFLIWIFLNLLPRCEDFQIAAIVLNNLSSFWSSLYLGIACFIFSYYAGWLLSTISNIEPFKKYSVNNINDKLSEEARINKNIIIEKSDHRIRLENENVGFRIVKLRAETRMLESSRTAMCLMAFFTFILIIYNILTGSLNTIWEVIFNKNFWFFIVPLAIVAYIFQESIAIASVRYIKSVEIYHELLLQKDSVIYIS